MKRWTSRSIWERSSEVSGGLGCPSSFVVAVGVPPCNVATGVTLAWGVSEVAVASSLALATTSWTYWIPESTGWSIAVMPVPTVALSPTIPTTTSTIKAGCVTVRKPFRSDHASPPTSAAAGRIRMTAWAVRSTDIVRSEIVDSSAESSLDTETGGPDSVGGSFEVPTVPGSDSGSTPDPPDGSFREPESSVCQDSTRASPEQRWFSGSRWSAQNFPPHSLHVCGRSGVSPQTSQSYISLGDKLLPQLDIL